MSKWIVDPDHSVAAFAIRHMIVAFVHGQFNRISGTLQFNPSDIISLSVNLEIDVNSLITGIKKRDDHLKSSDFLDVDKSPLIIFKSNNVELTAFNACIVRGDLTIHGITKPHVMEIVVSGPVKSPFGETTIGLTGKTVLNREDYGLTWNEPLENGGFMVGKCVNLYVNVEGDLVE